MKKPKIVRVSLHTKLAMDIEAVLFPPEKQRLQKLADEYILLNQEALRKPCNSVMHMGHRWLHSNARGKGKPHTHAPHDSLVHRFDVLIQQEEEFNRDSQLIMQGLSKALHRCETLQECRDVLPDSLIQEIPIIRDFPRMNEEGYIIKNEPKLYEQFQRAVELMLFYSASRLLA